MSIAYLYNVNHIFDLPLSVVGLPEEPIPPMMLWPLIATNIHMTGSAIGSPEDISEMFEVAVKHNVRPWIHKVSDWT